MTTDIQQKTCALCGSQHSYETMMSAFTAGYDDLDTRPPPTRRDGIFTLVHQCPDCGYCAADVSELRPGAESVVKSAEYRRQLHDKRYDGLANSFLCKAMIERADGDYAAAAWALIHAAWACDDEGRATASVTCRSSAANTLMVSQDRGQSFAEQDGADTAILADLLRRSGRTDDARKVIAEGQRADVEDVIVRVLEYQSALIDRGDTSCHTIGEAFEDQEKPDNST